jgi:hypothetical protein
MKGHRKSFESVEYNNSMISYNRFKLNTDPRDPVFDALFSYQNDEVIIDEVIKKKKRKI